MDNKTIENLVDLGIYKAKTIDKDEYDQKVNNTDTSLLYIEGNYDNGDKYYKEINTRGLTDEDVRLKLEIARTKMIISIKNMMIFFVLITVIFIFISFIWGKSIADVLIR